MRRSADGGLLRLTRMFFENGILDLPCDFVDLSLDVKLDSALQLADRWTDSHLSLVNRRHRPPYACSGATGAIVPACRQDGI